MADRMIEIASKLQDAQDRNLSVQDQAKAVVDAIDPPTRSTSDILWVMLVATLSLALLGSLGGVLVAALDGNAATSPDVPLTVVTTTLGTLVGLFVKSPTNTH